jgi:hypothetical protein
MTIRIVLFVLLGTGLIRVASAEPSAVHIAVVSDADDKDLAALVISELSGNLEFNLLERDDLAKIGDEAKVEQLAGSDAVALGRLAGADGLLFLQHASDGVHARFTATGLGFVLFDLQFGTDIHLNELAKVLANQVISLAPKLKLSPGEAIPVSILNLRAEYATRAAVKIERNLTLLLESRLSAVPKIVVLERRHAWALNFERKLAPGDSPDLIRGKYVLDGSLKISGANPDAITVALRMQSPQLNQPLALEINGTTADLSDLANQIVSAVVPAMGQPNTRPVNPSVAEGREYLREGIWAWRNGLSQPALEALDSAELLGETAPDLLAARIPVLCDLAAGVPTYERMNPEAFRMMKMGEMPIDPQPEERIDDILRAIDDATKYAKGGLEQKLVILTDIVTPNTRVTTFEGKTDRLTSQVQFAASKVLWLLDRIHHPREEELRQALRTFAGFDPLHHQIPNDWFCAVEYTELWSESPDEVIAYYQTLASTRPQNLLEDDLYDEMNRILLKDGPDNFCARFIPTTPERRVLFDSPVGKLIADPATKTTGLLVRATWSEAADKQAAYQAFLDDLSSNHERLAQTGDLGIYLTSAAHLQRELAKPACAEFIALLHYDLQNLPEWQEGTYCQVWQPNLFPAGDAPELWKEFEDCKTRTLAYVAQHTSADGRTTYMDDPSKLVPMFSKLKDAYVEQFGKPGPDASSPPVVLPNVTATQLWHAWQSPDNPSMPFHLLSYAMDDSDTVWVYGYHDPYGNHLVGDSTVPVTLFKIHIPDLKTESIAVPWRLTPVEEDSQPQIRFAPDAVYIFRIGNHLDRLQVSTGEWQRREVTPRISELYPVSGKLYFSVSDESGGLARYDWDSSQVVIMADSRRRPSQNQFDDRPAYTVANVLVTPDGKTCALIEGKNYVIQEQPGPWSTGQDFNPSAGFSVDHKDGVFWSTVVGRRFPATPTFPPYTKEWVWLGSLPQDAMDYGFRDHEIFALIRKSGFKFLWYQPYDSAPFSIPLDLQIDNATRDQLKTVDKFQFDDAIAPATGSLRMLISAEGICLFPTVNSGLTTLPIFWFVPFTDIDAYLKGHVADKGPPVFNPLSGIPPQALKAMEQAAEQAQHPDNAGQHE